MQTSLKEALYQKCVEVLGEKISFLQNTLNDLRSSAANETKSTAGDKHETALAMLQIEQENTGRQLKILLDQRRELHNLNISLKFSAIGKGSLVLTNRGTFFIAIALGKLQVCNDNIIVISSRSPLGLRLGGLKQGDSFNLNAVEYTILSFS